MATSPSSYFALATDPSIDNSSISSTDPFSDSANNPLATIPDTNYTFTPKRGKPLPRAWERKPATPFAPRNDAQKIWKRVPLPLVNLSFDANQSTKKDMMLAEETMRVLKRIKMSVSGRVRGGEIDEENKENYVFAPTKLEFEQLWNWSPVKRKVLRPADVGTLDEGLGGSIEEQDMFGEGVVCALPLDPELDADETESEEDIDEFVYRVDGDHTVTLPAPSQQHSGIPEPVVELANLDSPITENTSMMAEVLEGPISLLQTSRLESGVMSETPTSVPEPIIETEPTPNLPQNSTQFGSEVEDIHASSMPAEKSPVLQLHIAAISSTEMDAPLQAGSEPTLVIPDSCLDQDDTAFLHDFLKRARAQKAARVSLILQSDPVTIEVPAKEISEPEIDLISPQPPVLEFLSNKVFEPQLDDDTERELKASSPCRRSSRMLTRLPRPQKPITPLPNSIALKRLNGSEFIAMQQESQSLALVTRTNTKRNRGDAVPVKMKLIQLQFLPNEDTQSSEVPAVKESEILLQAGKLRKEVAWDNILARWEDGQKTLDQPTTGSNDVVKLDKESAGSSVETKDSTRKVRKIRKVNAGTVNGTPAPKRSLSLVFGSESNEESAVVVEGDGGRRLRTRVR